MYRVGLGSIAQCLVELLTCTVCSPFQAVLFLVMFASSVVIFKNYSSEFLSYNTPGPLKRPVITIIIKRRIDEH